MRITDVFLSFPPLLLAIAIATALGSGFVNHDRHCHHMVAVVHALVRAQTVSLRERYSLKPRAASACHLSRSLPPHILPNGATPVLVQGTMDLGSAILTGAAINFIGLGVQRPG